MRILVAFIIGIGWIVFWAGWLVAALTAKASSGGGERHVAVRIVLGVLVFGAVRLGFTQHLRPPVSGPALEVAGLVLWAAGLALAIWARAYIGRNWGMPMTRKEHPELVTSGPYRVVRNPIYSGIILAMLGTALAVSLYWLVPVALFGAYFVYSAVREARYLAGEFPDTYPAYQRSTKMLIPFIL